MSNTLNKLSERTLISRCAETVNRMLKDYKPKTLVEAKAVEDTTFAFERIVSTYQQCVEHGGIDYLVKCKKEMEKSKQAILDI